jgi:hypothetical protein
MPLRRTIGKIHFRTVERRVAVDATPPDSPAPRPLPIVGRAASAFERLACYYATDTNAPAAPSSPSSFLLSVALSSVRPRSTSSLSASAMLRSRSVAACW